MAFSLNEFRSIRIAAGPELDPLRDQVQREHRQREERLREKLELDIRPTPFVLNTPGGPARRVDVCAVVDGLPALVEGMLNVKVRDTAIEYRVSLFDLTQGAYPVLITEPDEPTDVLFTFHTSPGRTLESRFTLKPARHWTFYMTEHTHYDIGFTGPQAEVIDQLSRDMEKVRPFVEQTADWPEGSRFKWTVEVSGLLKNFIERHSQAEIDQMIDLIRRGNVEICGYYLNMPTELVGHEELIRGLYYAQQLRDRYGIQIDTAMIDDVPGYTWALPAVFVEAGIPRVSFRANSIRGQFLWYRDGAVPRPCYWQSPDGSKVFMWYTDCYREGNFWRQPGLQEDRFLDVISKNEAASCWVDLIQLRMGGDNLAPDIDVCTNTRQWNEKYVWPKVKVATNREFMEDLENRYGQQCQTFRGDIPSWWAEGPGSSALETGMNRLVHDQLVGVEVLWSALCANYPRIRYPHRAIHWAYENVLHFDEHVWGASDAVTRPRDEETFFQWNWKARYATSARSITDDLQHHALALLSESIPAPSASSIAVWNTLAWPRTDIVALRLVDAGIDRRTMNVVVTDTRSNQHVPAQLSKDGETVFFIARNVPSVGYAIFTIEPSASPAATTTTTTEKVLENADYRLMVDPDRGGFVSWYDKRLRRELLDVNADHCGNQAIHEVPIGDRETINRKKPLSFTRTPARQGTVLARRQGPVFQELVYETALPGCPRIRQSIRLYNDLPIVDLVNTIEKEEVFEPEGVYFAFPFDIPSPAIRLQIADAVMQAGVDQLPLSCYDFYSIQQWADVAGDGFGVILAPLEAPLVTVGGMNVYQWADRIEFDKGYVYSLALNNYWFTNFRGGQSGTIPARYRLTSYMGGHDAIRSTRFAWQPFYPLITSRLTNTAPIGESLPPSLMALEGDPVMVSCVKMAETADAMIVRMLEMRHQPARCRLKLALPEGQSLVRAFMADVVERPLKDLPVSNNSVEFDLQGDDIYTLGLVLNAR